MLLMMFFFRWSKNKVHTKFVKYLIKCLLFLICYCLPRTLASSGIGLCLLATNRQALSMADSSVASNFLESLDVHSNLSTKITFNSLSLSNDVCQLFYLIIG